MLCAPQVYLDHTVLGYARSCMHMYIINGHCEYQLKFPAVPRWQSRKYYILKINIFYVAWLFFIFKKVDFLKNFFHFNYSHAQAYSHNALICLYFAGYRQPGLYGSKYIILKAEGAYLIWTNFALFQINDKRELVVASTLPFNTYKLIIWIWIPKCYLLLRSNTANLCFEKWKRLKWKNSTSASCQEKTDYNEFKGLVRDLNTGPLAVSLSLWRESYP